jgi:hypothetical protein
MKNKCALGAARATLSEFRNGTWWVKMVKDIQTASPAKLSERQTANQTVHPSHSHTELHRLRLERLGHIKDLNKSRWHVCALGVALGVSAGLNIVLYSIVDGKWL